MLKPLVYVFSILLFLSAAAFAHEPETEWSQAQLNFTPTFKMLNDPGFRVKRDYGLGWGSEHEIHSLFSVHHSINLGFLDLRRPGEESKLRGLGAAHLELEGGVRFKPFDLLSLSVLSIRPLFGLGGSVGILANGSITRSGASNSFNGIDLGFMGKVFGEAGLQFRVLEKIGVQALARMNLRGSSYRIPELSAGRILVWDPSVHLVFQWASSPY